jgi:signal-transduction protein with cAMP-binding, CBS, and nucleotidyltransferase domain
MTRVKDILRGRELYSVQVAQTVAEVARHMASLNVGAILVLDNGDLKGVFSERDLLARVVVGKLDPETTPVGQVMSTNIMAVDENATSDEAKDCMVRHGCRHLPVLRGATLVGFLSMRDLMHFELERTTEELHHMHAYIHGQ